MTTRTVQHANVLLGEHWGAVFSEDDRRRYRLWRQWNPYEPTVTFCMLNPSTADHVQNDPTIERCMRRARAMKFGRLEIVNLFSLRSTDPKVLYETTGVIGEDDTTSILDAVKASEIVVCGWGTHGALHGRGEYIKNLLQKVYPHKLRVLAINKDGSPKHPLYVGYNVQPKEWT